jgi:hypothetical protein
LARWARLEFADVVSLGFFPLQPRFNEQMLNKYCIFDAAGWLEACSSHYQSLSQCVNWWLAVSMFQKEAGIRTACWRSGETSG